ncbi:MAG: acyltransferase [Erythrobacter sp.]
MAVETQDATDGQRGKLVEIQLLRAIAAMTVAFFHIALGFADNIGDGFGVISDSMKLISGRASQGAVMLFFVISGYIMVIASAGLFGRGNARRIFWTRRAVRIMPPYWLASAMLLAVFLVLVPRPIDWGQLAQSLFLIPFWSDLHGLRAQPFLWPGWTLFYEMVFYALFGLFLTRGRAMALGTAAVAICALVIAGLWVTPDMAPRNTFLWTLTRPVLLVFIAGMALALVREAGWQAGVYLRLAAGFAGIALCLVVPKPDSIAAMGFDYLAWCAAPAVLFAFAVLGGPLRVPFEAVINRLGDMSYALYLLHIPIAWGWIWLYTKLPGFQAGPGDYLVSAMIVTLLVSWMFHARIERPMTARLNALLAPPLNAPLNVPLNASLNRPLNGATRTPHSSPSE